MTCFRCSPTPNSRARAPRSHPVAIPRDSGGAARHYAAHPRSHSMRFTLSALASLLLAVCAAAADKPNILLVLSDDQSWAHQGCYGNPDIQTPNIDAFAKDAVRFDRYYVGTPQCVP